MMANRTGRERSPPPAAMVLIALREENHRRGGEGLGVGGTGVNNLKRRRDARLQRSPLAPRDDR
jgi:hypothetical protein